MENGFNPGKIRIMTRISDNPYKECYQPISHEILYYSGSKQIPEAEVYSRLGRMYFDGLGVEQDGIKGCRYLEIAYDKGSRNIRTGDYLMMGVYRHIETSKAIQCGVTRDLRMAIKWYACCLEECIQMEDEHGINLVLSHLGRAFVDDEIREYKSAFICLSQACCQEAEALFYLARMYDRGLYVKKNHKEAEYYISRIMETPEFEGEVFYDCAYEIMECWKMCVPDEVIDSIIYGLG